MPTTTGTTITCTTRCPRECTVTGTATSRCGTRIRTCPTRITLTTTDAPVGRIPTLRAFHRKARGPPLRKTVLQSPRPHALAAKHLDSVVGHQAIRPAAIRDDLPRLRQLADPLPELADGD